MGLGLTFMESFMDELCIESDVNQGTCVIMKNLLQRYGKIKKLLNDMKH